MGGVLACAECMAPYFVRALGAAFPLKSALERHADLVEIRRADAGASEVVRPIQRPIRLLDEDGEELGI